MDTYAILYYVTELLDIEFVYQHELYMFDCYRLFDTLIVSLNTQEVLVEDASGIRVLTEMFDDDRILEVLDAMFI
jgi:hypothetical protein